MAHPADEPVRAIAIHGVAPTMLAVLVLLLSVLADVVRPGMHWTQRAGSIVTVLGGYVAYVDAKRSVKLIDGSLYMNFELPYRLTAVLLVAVGTLVWGYGDLLL